MLKSVLFACSLLLLCTSANSIATEHITAFATDGCSSFPNGTPAQQHLWLSCCYQHDLAYWQGGTAQDRVAADEQLLQCVAAVGEPEIALLMLAGVRVGGSPYFPTKFRWGYGWPYPRGYRQATHDELQQIKQLLENLQQPLADTD